MKIVLILSTPLPPSEGIGYYSWNLASELIRNGHQVTLITRGGVKGTESEVINGKRIYRLPFIPLYPLHVHFHSFHVNRLIKELEPDIDIIHMHSPLVRVPKTQKPIVVTFHTPMKADVATVPATNFFGILARLQLPFSMILEKELIRHSDRIASVAESVAIELQQYGLDRRSVKIMSNGVDTNVFKPSEAPRKLDTPRYFLTVGRLGPRKGLEDLLKCAKIVIDYDEFVQFWIAGSGPYAKGLNKIAEGLGISQNVKFLGHVSNRDDMVLLYQNALGLIHPAHYEGLPTVLLEGMACGCPVIATAVSGALDIIRDGVNGLFALPKAPELMAEKAKRLLIDADLRNSLSHAAVASIRNDYSWEVVGRNYINLYNETIQEKIK